MHCVWFGDDVTAPDHAIPIADLKAKIAATAIDEGASAGDLEAVVMLSPHRLL
jgi:hypothetical protein